MTKQEVVKLFALISTAYPRTDAFRRATPDAVEMWAMCLEDIPFEVVQKAFVAHSVNSEFPPSIAEIRRAALQGAVEKRDTAEEAWALVLHALKNSAYNSVEEFAKLPDICKRCVGSAQVLKEWAVSEDFNQDVAKSNFARTYRELDKREQERMMLPPSVRAALDEAMSHNLLSEGADA